jgi:rod shape-determining protein MreC
LIYIFIKKFFFLIITIEVVLYIFDIDRVIEKNFSILSKNLSTLYINSITTTKELFNKYINQLQYIKQLEYDNKNLINYKVLYTVAQNRLKELENKVDINNSNKLSFKKVKALSYYSFDTNSKVILDLNLNNQEDKIGALITYSGYSVGIVIKKGSLLVAILNNDQKCNYAVFIGKDRASGITTGMDKDGILTIDYIPL